MRNVRTPAGAPLQRTEHEIVIESRRNVQSGPRKAQTEPKMKPYRRVACQSRTINSSFANVSSSIAPIARLSDDGAVDDDNDETDGAPASASSNMRFTIAKHRFTTYTERASHAELNNEAN